MQSPNYRLVRTALALAIAIELNPAWAESLELDPVRVDGVKHDIYQRLDSINPRIVIEREELTRYADSNIGSVLRRLPGVVIGGPPGEAKDVRLRGLDKEYTQILINGKRIPGGGEKREFQVDRIPTALVERIEIIRNPRPDIDAQGVGGTINIVLRQVPESRFAELWLGGNSFDGEQIRPRGSLSFGGNADDFGFIVAADAQRRETEKDKIKQKFKGDGTLKDSEDEQEEKIFTDLALTPRLTWQPNADFTLEFAPLWLYSDEDKDKIKRKLDGNGNLKELEDEAEENVRETVGGDVIFTRSLNDLGELSMDLGWRESTEDKENNKQVFKNEELDKLELETEDKEDAEFSAVGRWRDLALGNHALAFTVDLLVKERDKRKIKTENGELKTGPKDNFSIDETKLALSAADVWQITPTWLLSPGLRIEWLERDAADASGFEQSDDHVDFHPSLQTVWRALPWLNLRAAGSRTVRQPKFDELVPVSEEKDGTFDDPDQAGNPNLEPERAWSLDAGFEIPLLKNTALIGVNGFYRYLEDKIENRIIRDPDSARFVEIPVNVGTGETWGVEFDGQLPLSPLGLKGLSLHGNATLLDSRIKDPRTGEVRPFKDQPSTIFNIGLNQHIDAIGMAFGGNFNFTGERENVEFKDENRVIETEDETAILDVYLHQSLGRHAELRLTASNLLGAEKDKRKTTFKTDGAIKEFEFEHEDSGPTFQATFIVNW